MIDTTTTPVTWRIVLKVNGLLLVFLFFFDLIIKSVEIGHYYYRGTDNNKCVIAEGG